MTVQSFLLASAIVFAGFVVRGFTGFGAVLFILPLLALWLPVRLVVPLLAVLGIVNGAWLAVRCRSQVDRGALALLLYGSLPGMILGLLLFQRAADDNLRRALGVLLVLLGAWLTKPPPDAKGDLPTATGVGAGLLSGFLGALFGVSGPPGVAYLSRRGLETAAFRATMVVLILAIDAVRGAAYAVQGGVDRGVWLAGLALFPASLLGSWCGERLQIGVSERTFRLALGVLLAAMGLLLTFSP